MNVKRILFPTDFSAASTEILERAVALALRTGAQLRILHVEALHERDPARLQKQRDVTLARVDTIREQWPTSLPSGADVAFASEHAVSPFEGIINDIESFQPDVVVMATHGGKLLMGSVAERVVRHAPCNVLTARADAQGQWPMLMGRIMVPVDFSDNSKRALAAARELPGGCPISVVHVVETGPPPQAYREAVRSPFEADPELEARIEAHLREWAGAPVDAVLALEGEVRTMLIDECRRQAAALIVVGAHGHRSVAAWVIGSTAERLTRSCPAPVLTMR
jgi:nucleotide-binding universal stress UspA family protein